MTDSPQDITALLGSRICHDLISPLGAISNGIELLKMSDITIGPEIELISESIDNANARIRYFRVAFGAATASQLIGASEIRGILADVQKGSRLNIDWRVNGELPRREVKLVFLLLQCFETAMPWGGQITMFAEGAGWTISGASDRMKILPNLWRSLSHPDEQTDIDAASVQFLLLPPLLTSAERQLTMDIGDTGIVARF